MVLQPENPLPVFARFPELVATVAADPALVKLVVVYVPDAGADPLVASLESYVMVNSRSAS